MQQFQAEVKQKQANEFAWKKAESDRIEELALKKCAFEEKVEAMRPGAGRRRSWGSSATTCTRRN